MADREPCFSQRPLAPGLIADARRALFVEEQRTLVVADAHLGYAWVERQRGALLPLRPDDTPERVVELLRAYRPARCVFLGDTVHATAELEVIAGDLRRLLDQVRTVCEPVFVLGNHDMHLAAYLERLGLSAEVTTRLQVGPHVLVHGHLHAREELDPRLGQGGRIVYGHEHPAVSLGDGIVSLLKFPCFLTGPGHVVVPAFSAWAAGVCMRSQPMLSALATREDHTQAVAIVGDRLVPLSLSPAVGASSRRGSGRGPRTSAGRPRSAGGPRPR